MGDCRIGLRVLVVLSASMLGPTVARSEQSTTGAVQTAAARDVQPPRLIHFEEADYPVLAQEQGLVGDVVLRLTVGDDGAVVEAEVVDAAGNGFDEAALAAASKFVFEPARRSGVAVKARILYRYSFSLKTAPTPESAAHVKSGDMSPVGALSVLLLAAEGDLPLAGADVIVTTPAGERLRRNSDESGRLELKQVPAGRYHLSAKKPGFADTELEEAVAVGEVTAVTYRVPFAIDTEAIEVTVQGERPLREVTRRTIERREVERIPGTSGDALRAIESLPGVARPPAFAGMLIVRGSYPEDTRVYVDGSVIPLLYHFGGLRSVLPTEFLERIDFYPGNFGAKFGRAMGGIVDVGLRSPQTRCQDERGHRVEREGCFSGVVQLDLVEGRLLLEGPLPVKGWAFAGGLRRSWFDAWIGPVLSYYGANVTSLPVYDDYQVILERNSSRGSRTSLRFFGADDSFAAIVDPLAREPALGGSVQYATSFWQGQLLHVEPLSAQVSLSTLVTQGRTRLDFSVGTLKLEMLSYPFHWREELQLRAGRGIRFNVGFDHQVYPYHVTARTPALPEPGQPTSGPFSTRPLVEISESVLGMQQGFYLDAEVQPTERLRIVAGMRIDYSRGTRSTDVSPRINGRYDLVAGNPDGQSGGRRRTTVKGGVGLYYQPPLPQETNAVYGTVGLTSNRSIHYALGVEQELSSQVEVSLEGFYKDFDSLVAPGTPSDADRYTNEGLGRSYGLETLLRYKPDRRMFGWIAYTLSRSERRDYAADEPFLMPFDQTHNLTMLGSYRLGRGWEFGARFRVISGALVTEVRRTPSLPSVYAADAGTYVPLQGAPYSERLPVFHQLDLRLDKRWQIQRYRISTYLDVYNVYNNPGVERLKYDYGYSHHVYMTGVPILPSVGVRAEF